jgi:hypothetical protein
MAVLTQNKAKFCKKLIIKNANFFAENWAKSQKIVIITFAPDPKFLTPGRQPQVGARADARKSVVRKRGDRSYR